MKIQGIVLEPIFSSSKTSKGMSTTEFYQGNKTKNELIGARLKYDNQTIQIPLHSSSIPQNIVTYTGNLNRDEIQSLTAKEFFEKLQITEKELPSDNIPKATVFAHWDWLTDRFMSDVKVHHSDEAKNYACLGDASIAKSDLNSYDTYKI